MFHRKLKRAAQCACTAALLALLTACGGGGGGGGGNPPPPAITVTVSPSTQSVVLGAQQTFTAAVSGTANTAVTWSVNGIAGGNSTVGTISAQGQYTAPQVLPANTQVTIRATSQASSGSFGTATVTITSDVVVSVTASSLSVELGAQQQFNAAVQSAGNPLTTVTWSVSGAGCAGATCGTIDANTGLYTAPRILPNPATVTVRATSLADASRSGTANANITSTFQLSVSGIASLNNATSSTYAAVFTPAPNSNPDTSVTWSVAAAPGGACTGPGTGANQCGTIDTATGFFTAATIAPAAPGNVVRITATSVADPAKTAFIDVTIISIILVTITPSNSNIELDTAQTFTATVGGATNQNVIWDVNGVVGGNATVGTITNPGSGPATYTAPASLPNPTTVTLTAKWNDPAATAADRASVSVTLFSTISIALSAPSSVRAVNRRVTITGTITRQGGSAPLNKAVTWRVNGVPGGNSTVGQICLVEANRTSTNCVSNTVSNGDLPVDYLAPAGVPGGNPVTIEAESQADTSRKGNFQVTVQPNVTVTIAPLASTLPVNQRQVFVATVIGSDFDTATWQVNGVLNGDATNGTICVSASNPCTAPPHPASQVEYLSPGAPPPNPPVKVRAISADDPTQFAEANVTIQTGAFITSIQPASITAGPANSFTLRVRGSNFSVNPLSTIKFNGNNLTTSCATSTECTATIAASDVSSAGNFAVQVENPSGATFPGLSNAVNMVVVAQTSSEAVITLDPNNPTASGQDITVVEPTTSGSAQGPAGQVNVDTIGIISGNSCTLRGSPIRILRPSSGSPPNVVNICLSGVLGSSALDASFTYTLSGPSPADVTISSVQNFGTGGNVVQLTLNVPSSALTGPRTILVENAQKEKSALVGSIEIK